MKRQAQIVTGTVILLVSLVLPLGIIFAVGEQPSTGVLIGAGVGSLAGLWFLFPAGTGRFGDWIASLLPFLEGPEDDDD